MACFKDPNSPIYYNLPIRNKYIWQCNIYKCDRFWNNHVTLSGQVWKAWTNVNFFQPINKSEIIDQPIWYNHFNRSRDTPLFWKSWFDAGIQKIRDIYDFPNKRFYSMGELQHQYPSLVTNFMECASLIAAIQNVLKIQLKQDVLETEDK